MHGSALGLLDFGMAAGDSQQTRVSSRKHERAVAIQTAVIAVKQFNPTDPHQTVCQLVGAVSHRRRGGRVIACLGRIGVFEEQRHHRDHNDDAGDPEGPRQYLGLQPNLAFVCS